MAIQYDPAKDAANIAKHGLSLATFPGFDGDVHVQIDDRYAYGEERFRAWGRIGGQEFCIAYTIRRRNIRLISFRRDHEREMRHHDKTAGAGRL